ncbi:hypothetical protein M758_1G007900, partial [Ceratodon purpureus]
MNMSINFTIVAGPTGKPFGEAKFAIRTSCCRAGVSDSEPPGFHLPCCQSTRIADPHHSSSSRSLLSFVPVSLALALRICSSQEGFWSREQRSFLARCT